MLLRSQASLEEARLATLRELRVLDTLPEQVYDDIVKLASQICGAPMALISLVDEERQWFKARVGLDGSETSRDVAFCAHAIKQPAEVFIVEDATQDARFRDNPLVTADPNIRFYAGAPIVMPDGQAMGTVCVIDTVPRALSESQIDALRALSRQATALLELRQVSQRAADERARSAELLDLVLRGGNLGLWDLHLPSGRFTANAREYEMLGHEASVSTPLNWRELVHPDDWPVLKTAMDRHLSGDAGGYACEHRMRHHDGRWVWVLDHAIVVERDAHGAPLRIVGTHMDISTRVRNREALQHAQGLLLRMGQLAKVGGWEFDLTNNALSWTDEVYRIHALEPGSALDLSRCIAFYPGEARATIEGVIETAIATGAPWDMELPFIDASGRELTVRTQGEAVMEGGRATRLFGTFQDVTEHRRAEQALIDSQRHLRLITDNLPALIAHIDLDERYTFLNAHIQRVFGIDVERSIGRAMREVRSEDAYAQVAPHVAAALRGEPASFTYSEEVRGRRLHLQSNYIPDVDADGRVRGFFAMTFDISELRETQNQLELLARVDTLTGLPNRRQFDERIAEAMLRTRRAGRTLAVMFLDIDHFKAINDSLGHAGGDAVLCEFARRLRACIRATDTVARLAGDEFVVLLEGVDDAVEVEWLASKVVSCIQPAFQVGQTVLNVTTSVGVTTYRGTDLSPTQLLDQADGALYQAKRQGRNRFALV